MALILTLMAYLPSQPPTQQHTSLTLTEKEKKTEQFYSWGTLKSYKTNVHIKQFFRMK